MTKAARPVEIRDDQFEAILALAYWKMLYPIVLHERLGKPDLPEKIAEIDTSIRTATGGLSPTLSPQEIEDYLALATNSGSWPEIGPNSPVNPAPIPELKPDETIGIVLVHGVGEQTRFEHLDGEIRKLVESLRAMPVYQEQNGGKIVVEITPAEASGFHASQDIWQIGPRATVQVIAATRYFGAKRFSFHEVWWADINERYSIAKQIRFWLWGLSVWKYPRKERSGSEGAEYVFPPVIQPGRFLGLPVSSRLLYAWVRVRLFMVAVLFSMLGFSVAIIIYILNRLFDMETPKILQTITNYVSGVKLYNQPSRRGPALWYENDDFLDNVDVPPRYSIRRRMIRALADVALADYDRWYVLAHSLGSVVAFNGLMETAYTWPGYLDRKRWDDLVGKKLAGKLADGASDIPAETTPCRPSWAGDDIAYRKRIFAKFRGMLTYGSPLEKFATIWPARVPIAREPAFGKEAVWVNAMDPIDPVSGVLKSFGSLPPACCPRPRNIGYRAWFVLLAAHLEYLTPKGSIHDLPSSVMAWMLGMRGEPGNANNDMQGFAYPEHEATFRRRTAIAWAWWIVGFAGMAVIAGVIFPTFVKLIVTASAALGHEACNNTGLPCHAIMEPIRSVWSKIP
ncbi:MAG TPA: hypothetical protein VHX92_01735 [Rhizomicrobium sp.]|nr:hypothetical protein [Rhizomicrobium sp.]